MKVAVSLTLGIVLGLVIANVSGAVFGHFTEQEGFARFHPGEGATASNSADNSTTPSPAIRLMQTDTALCDQPYFVELYELSNSSFSPGAEKLRAEEYAEVVFEHARNSGYFTAEEAETWIRHIENVPFELVGILEEDPAVFDSCYNFQVAVVGPPA